MVNVSNIRFFTFKEYIHSFAIRLAYFKCMHLFAILSFSIIYFYRVNMVNVSNTRFLLSHNAYICSGLDWHTLKYAFVCSPLDCDTYFLLSYTSAVLIYQSINYMFQHLKRFKQFAGELRIYFP